METDEILRLLREIADEVIVPRFRSLNDGEIDEKNPGDLVTVADREAEVLITDALAAAYPRAIVLGEEAYAADPSLMDRFLAADHSFTVDPVDGTKNFVHGSADYAVMVAEIRGGAVVRSWIWQPQHKTSYVAERGAGAFCNGLRLVVADPPRERDRWVGATSRRGWVGRSIDDLPPLRLSWVCCGVDYPQVIAGRAAFVLYGRAQPWDHAPGGLLLSEAGGVLGTHDGRPYSPHDLESRVLAASGRDVYDAVWPLV